MKGLFYILAVLSVSIGMLSAAELTEEFEKGYTIVTSSYGDVAYSHMDSNGDGKLDSLVMIGDAGSTLKFIRITGQPSVVWTRKLQGSNKFDIASIDLTGNGYRDHIVGGTNSVGAYDSEGNKVWSYTTNSSVYSVLPLDLDNDGAEDEVVVGLWEKVVALSSSGKKMWKYRITGGGDRLLALDRDGDGTHDSVGVAVRSSISVLNRRGEVRGSVSSSHFDSNIAAVGSYHASDRSSRLAAIDSGGKLGAFDLDGNKLWGSNVYLDESDLADISSLDYSEVGLKDHVAVFTGFIYLFNKDGNKVWTYSKTIFNDFALADLDGNGLENEFFASTDSKLYAISRGQQVGFYYYEEDSVKEKEGPYNRTGAEEITSIDMDGDGSRDDILGITSTEIFTLSHKAKAKEKRRLVVVANSIDYRLASDLFLYLRDAGYEVIHVWPEDFSDYRKERNIVILGGHKAPEGTGEIVADLLTTEQKRALEEEGAAKHYELGEIYSVGQEINIYAGNTRDETRQAHRQNRGELL